jgi:hypothetical protein
LVHVRPAAEQPRDCSRAFLERAIEIRWNLGFESRDEVSFNLDVAQGSLKCSTKIRERRIDDLNPLCPKQLLLQWIRLRYDPVRRRRRTRREFGPHLGVHHAPIRISMRVTKVKNRRRREFVTKDLEQHAPVFEERGIVVLGDQDVRFGGREQVAVQVEDTHLKPWIDSGELRGRRDRHGRASWRRIELETSLDHAVVVSCKDRLPGQAE